jgi:hypothetical protein
MDYKYQNQGQSSDQFHPINKGKQVAVFVDIIAEPDCNEQNNTNGSNNTTEICNINNTTTITEILNINNTFSDWDAIEAAVNTFAKHNGFVAIKFCKDFNITDKTITHCHNYKY